jgi:hypothetical protein
MVKRVLWVTSALALLAAIWYFFLKPYHLSVGFNTPEASEVVYQHLLEWPVSAGDSLEINTLETEKPNSVIQQVERDSLKYRFNWSVERKAPGRTRVVARISALDFPLQEKLNLLLGTSSLKAAGAAQVRSVYQGLKNKSGSYRVHSFKDSLREPVYCAYISLKSQVDTKAAVMRSNIQKVMGYINQNELQLAGDPFLEITKWDRVTDSIEFNFCFPVVRTDSMPVPPREVKLKITQPLRGLKAEFNGNYRYSHRAWYYLLEKAGAESPEGGPQLVEVFLNDPHEAGDPLTWKALIYLPLEK